MGGSIVTLAGMFGAGGFGAEDLVRRRTYLPTLTAREVPIHLGPVTLKPWVPSLRRDELKAMVYPVAPYEVLRKHFLAYQKELPLLEPEQEGESTVEYEERLKVREAVQEQVIAPWMRYWWLGIATWAPHMKSEDIPYALREIAQTGERVKFSQKDILHEHAPKYIGVERHGALDKIVKFAVASHPMLEAQSAMLPNPSNKHVVYVLHGHQAMMYAILAELKRAGYDLHFAPHTHEWVASLLKGEVPSAREVAQNIPRIYALAPLVKSPVTMQRFRRADFVRALGMFQIPLDARPEQLGKIALSALYEERKKLLKWQEFLVPKIRRPEMVMGRSQKDWFARRAQNLHEAYLVLDMIAKGYATVIG